MAQEGSTAISAPSDVNGGSDFACGKVLGVAHPVRWGSGPNPNWAKLKPYQKRKFSTYEEVFKRPRSGWEPPRTRNVPYRDWETGLLIWDTKSCWWHCLSLECPDFPDVLDEDIFQLLHVFGVRERRSRVLCTPDIDLYRWAIVLAAKRAVNDLGR